MQIFEWLFLNNATPVKCHMCNVVQCVRRKWGRGHHFYHWAGFPPKKKKSSSIQNVILTITNVVWGGAIYQLLTIFSAAATATTTAGICILM